jgi:hypothetical protein
MIAFDCCMVSDIHIITPEHLQFKDPVMSSTIEKYRRCPAQRAIVGGGRMARHTEVGVLPWSNP